MYQILFSLLVILFFLFLAVVSSYVRRAATPAKSWRCDIGRKLSNSDPRRLFKNTFAETYFTKGSAPVQGDALEYSCRSFPVGFPFPLRHMHQIQWKAALLTPASSFCLNLCILATRGCKREGKKRLFSTRQSAAASQSRIFSGTL